MLRKGFPGRRDGACRKGPGTHRTVAARDADVVEPAGVDDHSAVVQVEEPRENFRLRHRHVENEPAADFLFDVPEQEYYPAQFSMPVVVADEAAFDIEFQIVPAG